MAPNPVEFIVKLIWNANHHIATAHGVSDSSYTSTKEKPVDGSRQGGANSALSYNNSSDLFLDFMDRNNSNNAVIYQSAYVMGKNKNKCAH